MVRSKGFSLIELLIAFSISTILLGSIYFFHISFLKTGGKTREMALLNMNLNNKLERISRELKHAVEITALYPDKLRFKRQQLPAGELSAADLETSKFETIEYRLEKKEGATFFYRQEGFSNPEKMFKVQECNANIFKGYVLLSAEETSFGGKPLPFPSFKIFDTITQGSVEVNQIPLVRIEFNVKHRKDQICIINKVFMPIIYARLIEPDWNAE